MSFRQTVDPVMFIDKLKEVVESLITLPVAAPLAAPKVKLFTNDINPSDQTTLGEFTEATFGGYAAVSPTMSGGVLIGTSFYNSHGEANFVATDPIGTAENVLGYYVTNAGDTELYMSERFTDAVSFANPDDFLSLDLIIGLGSDWPVPQIG